MKKFAVKVRLEGEVALLQYTKEGNVMDYLSTSGIDDAGDRVSLVFFNEDVRDYVGRLVSGETVS